jgi:hypothetical protein
MFYRSIIDDTRSAIDDSRVMLQPVASFMIVLYDCYTFIIQTTGVNIVKFSFLVTTDETK